MNKNSSKRIIIGGILLGFCFSVFCCRPKNRVEVTDTLRTGTIHISVDESFKPVIDEEIKVFENTNPGAKIIAHYKPEAECLRDILRDSLTRMVIVTRGLTDQEERHFKDSLNFYPRWDEIATDAIVLIVNTRSTDTVFSYERLRRQLTGQGDGIVSIGACPQE